MRTTCTKCGNPCEDALANRIFTICPGLASIPGTPIGSLVCPECQQGMTILGRGEMA